MVQVQSRAPWAMAVRFVTHLTGQLFSLSECFILQRNMAELSSAQIVQKFFVMLAGVALGTVVGLIICIMLGLISC